MNPLKDFEETWHKCWPDWDDVQKQCFGWLDSRSWTGHIFKIQLHIWWCRSNSLLGDFNIDWTSESFEKHALEKFMTHKLHYRQAIKGLTTDYNTTIDLIFTNIQTYKCGIMEAYYTDHKLCWISVVLSCSCPLGFNSLNFAPIFWYNPSGVYFSRFPVLLFSIVQLKIL